MAHRVAELIDAASKARSVAAQRRTAAEAADLVLRLWEHRSHWPKGWPPAAAVKVLAALDRSPYQRERAPSGSPWLDLLSRLEDLQASERRIWFGASLVDLDLEDVTAVLADDSIELGEEERRVFEGLLQLRERATRELFDGTIPQSAEQRAEVARRELVALQAKRKALIAEVVTATKKPSGAGGAEEQDRNAERKVAGVVRKARPGRRVRASGNRASG